MSRSLEKPSPAEIDAAATDWLLRTEAGLSAAERTEFDRWRIADPSHPAALERARQAWSTLDRPRLAGRGHEMVRALGVRATRRRRRRVAAAMVGIAAVLVFALQWTPRREALAWPSTARLVVPEKRTLPDGTVAELRPGAEIAVDFSAQFRRVALRAGEALFDVAKDPARPFIVSTGEVEVRAVGTAFVVARAAGKVEVIVTEGRVAVDRGAPGAANAPPAAGDSPATLLAAGQRAQVDLTAGSARTVDALSPADLAARLDWRTPRVAFTAAALADAVAIMNQHSNVKLVIADPALAGLPVNGVFRLGNSETMLRLLETGFAVQADRNGDAVILRQKP